MYAALIRAAERWRGIRIGEFERRQLRAIRDELNKDFAARTAPAMAPTLTASPTRLSSKDQELDLERLKVHTKSRPDDCCSKVRNLLYNHDGLGIELRNEIYSEGRLISVSLKPGSARRRRRPPFGFHTCCRQA